MNAASSRSNRPSSGSERYSVASSSWTRPRHRSFGKCRTSLRITFRPLMRHELHPTGERRHSPILGDAEVLDVRLGDLSRPAAAWRYPDSPIEAIRDHVRFDWDSMDEWLEEDEPVYTHARDPHTRVDILASSRHVRVVVDDVTVADSRAPRILLETNLPPRFYLPMTDVLMELLEPRTLSRTARTRVRPDTGRSS